MDRLFDNDSHMNNFQFDFPQMNYQASLYMEQHNQNQDQYHQEVSPDGSSSPSSFMCLSKPSYEKSNSSDYEGSGSDEQNHQLPKIIKRAIYKNYEPIVDNGLTYNYQDDPVEYKKARKRVQNRVSATRIRGKNKNFVEELKVEVEELKDEITGLKTQNNVLTSENSLLKQQITFLERLLMGGNGKPGVESAIEPVAQDIKIDMKHTIKESASYSRTNNSNGKLKKHTAYLGVMTILLCISGIITQGVETRNIMSRLAPSSGLTQFISFPTHPTHKSELGYTVNANPTSTTIGVPGNLSWLSLAVLGLETIFIAIYVFYAIYVFSIAHRKFINTDSEERR